jgi:hypothetical protein
LEAIAGFLRIGGKLPMARIGQAAKIGLFFAVCGAIATMLWITVDGRLPTPYLVALLLMVGSGVPFAVGARRLKADGYNRTMGVIQMALAAMAFTMFLGGVLLGALRGGVLTAMICLVALVNCSPLLLSLWIERRDRRA